MRSIEASWGAVALENIWVVPGQVGPPIIVREVDRSGVGVRSLDQQSMRELAIAGNLKRVIVATQVALPKIGFGSAVPKLQLVERLSGLSRTRQRSVHVSVGELMNRLRAYVRRRHKEVGRKFALNGQIPRLNIAPLKLARANAALQCLRRQRDNALADIRTADRRDSDWDSTTRKGRYRR